MGAGDVSEFSVFRLPWPPTVNHYWRSTIAKSRTTGKAFANVYLSKAAKEYRASVLGAIGLRRRRLLGSIEVCLVLHPPDRRVRDIDNVLKPVLDALAHARVYEDDKQIAELHVRKASPVPHGFVEVQCRKLPEKQAALEFGEKPI
jgi:crossover junction endodeoxyribonuclease RusA